MADGKAMVLSTFVYLLSLCCWIGAIVFFSFFTAPIVFTRLPVAEAGKVVRGIFPLYYMLGYVAGLVAVCLAVYFALNRGNRGWWSGAALLLAIALGLTVYAGAVVRPRTEAVRSVVEEQNPDLVRKAQFDSLHRLSVILNGSVLILDLAALAATSAALVRNG